MPPVRPLEIPSLPLRRASESRPLAVGPDDYDVIEKDGEVIGRIVKTATGSAGKPWMWSNGRTGKVRPSVTSLPARPLCRGSRRPGTENEADTAQALIARKERIEDEGTVETPRGAD